MLVKIVEAAEEFVATQKIGYLSWNSTASLRAYLKLEKAVEQHKALRELTQLGQETENLKGGD